MVELASVAAKTRTILRNRADYRGNELEPSHKTARCPLLPDLA
jgi:hypothetical protein